MMAAAMLLLLGSLLAQAQQTEQTLVAAEARPAALPGCECEA
jgi:hypothetical protein